MTDRIIIVGGGGFGRELIMHAGDAHAAGRGPAVLGYLDDAGDVLRPLGYDLEWLGRVSEYNPRPGDLFALGLGGVDLKRRAVERLRAVGGEFATIIHPTSLVTTRTSIGQGVILGPFTGTGTDTRIGDFVTMNSYSGLGHDAEIGSYTTLSAHVDIMGHARIGSGVLIGSRASILPKVKVGDGAKIGAGAVVYRSVPAGATAYARPAKLLRSE